MRKLELALAAIFVAAFAYTGWQWWGPGPLAKPATVETGYQIQVPLFLEQGTKVKVDTRTGDYLGRVS